MSGNFRFVSDILTLTEIKTVMRTVSLPQLVMCQLDGWAQIKRTWERGSYKMCPWWIWREDEGGVLHFNLLGLTCHVMGWMMTEDAAPLHGRVSPRSRHYLECDDKRFLGKDLVTVVSEKLFMYPDGFAYKFFAAVDAIRRGDYPEAADQYYMDPLIARHLVSRGPSKVYILGDESARDPEQLMYRLRRDLRLLGPVDIHEAYRV